MRQLKNMKRKLSIMYDLKTLSVDTKIKRVFKTTASMFMIIALAITMLTVSGLGANKAYAGTSTSTSGVKYAVTIRDNSKTTTLYIDSEKTPAEIKSGIESYVKAQNSSVIKVSFDEDASIEVTPLSGTGKTYSTLALTTAAENADSIDAMSFDEAISKIVADKDLDITTVESQTSTSSTDYKTIYKKSSKVRKTTKKVKRAGVSGKTTKVYYVTKVNGDTTDTSLVDTTSTDAVTRIVIKGTGSVKVRKYRTYSGTSGKAIVAYAKKFVGNPYRYGGTSLTHGTDCSGFVQSVYKHFGLNLPRVDQYTVGKRVSMSNLKPGDLLSYSGHVAIYAGNGKIVHAVTYGQGIRVTSMYYGGHPYRATRIVK